jgi:outer membrane murein-binding lipoprotein Lpp
VRNPVIALGTATLATLVIVAVLFFALLLQLRGDVDRLADAFPDRASVGDLQDEVRDLHATLDRLASRLDGMAERFDRLDASIARIPTETQDDTQIGTILSEVQALRNALDGLSLDLGIVCDVLGC